MAMPTPMAAIFINKVAQVLVFPYLVRSYLHYSQITYCYRLPVTDSSTRQIVEMPDQIETSLDMQRFAQEHLP